MKAHLKSPCLVAGMAAGADAIDDMDVLPSVGRIRDLGPDVRAGGGQLGKCRAGPRDRARLAVHLARLHDADPDEPGEGRGEHPGRVRSSSNSSARVKPALP